MSKTSRNANGARRARIVAEAVVSAYINEIADTAAAHNRREFPVNARATAGQQPYPLTVLHVNMTRRPIQNPSSMRETALAA